MFIEVGVPASLPLGLVRLQSESDAAVHWLGVTLQHPPVHLRAQAYPTLLMTGARAGRAYELARTLLQAQGWDQPALIEIELAIPACMGLGSDAMLGLSVAQALAWVNGHPLDQPQDWGRALGLGPQHALNIWGFIQGGLLVVDAESPAGPGLAPRLRCELAHPDQEAWAWVLFFPRISEDMPATLEEDRLATWLKAAPYLPLQSGSLVEDTLWPAMKRDDISAFGEGLMALREMQRQALAKAGHALPLNAQDQRVLQIMRDFGAHAWGQSLAGRALFGLVRGATASVELRTELRRHIGYYGGRVMATITANEGARHVIHDGALTV